VRRSAYPVEEETVNLPEMSETPAKIFVCHVDHEHDRIYAENVVEYLNSQSVVSEVIKLRDAGLRPELQRCLEEPQAAVLGFNATLDHSWLKSGPFLEAAERCGLPVMQWILDHPSGRWPEFGASTASNSCFLLNTRQQQRYFETYCLPGALTAVTGGVGPNLRTRRGDLDPQEFVSRPLLCLIPLSLRRIRSVEEHAAARAALDPVLAGIVGDAAVSAQHDLAGPLHPHVATALTTSAEIASPTTFDMLCHIVEEAVQTSRRLYIFSVARDFPVLIQSDASAASFVEGGAASFSGDTGMQATLERMPTCRAVLSVTPMNDMIHDRIMNAVNAGCVAVAEDNAANREIFTHGENALLFRYDDDSLAECLDIVCNQPERAYEIARAGMKLRDDPRIRFGQFANIVDLARRGRSSSFLARGIGGSHQSQQFRPQARPVAENDRGMIEKQTEPVETARLSCFKSLEQVEGSRVALMVAHAPNGQVKANVPVYVAALCRAGIRVVLVAASDQPLVIDPDLTEMLVGGFVRDNKGYDFAAWAHLLKVAPELWRADALFLLNDSVIGPLSQERLDDLLRRIARNTADVVGATENFEFEWHLQSYFMAFKPRALASDTLRSFFEQVMNLPDKNAVIHTYEIPLTRTLMACGLTCAAAYRSRDDVNQTLGHWRDLINDGFPFVKTEVLRQLNPRWDVAGWQETLAATGFDPSVAAATVAAGQTTARQKPAASGRKRQAVLVLGMHRSGTSALAGVINALGAAAPKTLLAPKDDNPRGFFESAALVAAHDDLLKSAGSRWDDWRQFDPLWFRSSAAEEHREKLKELLIEEFGNEPLIVLKDPRVCRFAPFTASILSNLNFHTVSVIPVRNPLEVAYSLQRRNNFAIPVSVFLWLRHVLDAELFSRRMQRCFLLYEEVLADWQCQMGRLAEETGIKWPIPYEDASAKVTQFLTPDLHRERVSIDQLKRHPEVTQLARDTYDVLATIVSTGETKELLDSLDLIRSKFDDACDIFEPELATDKAPNGSMVTAREGAGNGPSLAGEAADGNRVTAGELLVPDPDREHEERAVAVTSSDVRQQEIPRSRRPEVSVVVVVYNMAREAPRTLYSLSVAYQQHVAADDYEVIVVDNGSEPPFDTGILDRLAGNFRLIRMDPPHPSPAPAANRGLAEARGRIVGMMIDGARMVTPGLLHFARHAVGLYERAAVTALTWHLGFDMQGWAVEAGYNKDREDALLTSIDWPRDGYRLFEIATLAGSSTDGWFLPNSESNALFLRREIWDELGGFDERFDSAGGGLVNCDTWHRLLELPEMQQVILLGEGSFHQLHGGIATNATPQVLLQRLEHWYPQYEAIRGHPWKDPDPQHPPTYLGTLPRPALARLVRAALDPARARLNGREPPLGADFDRGLWSLAPHVRPGDPVIAAVVDLAHEEFRAGRFEAAAAVARLVRQRAPDEPEPQRLLAQAGVWLPHPDPSGWGPEVHLALGEAHRLLGEGETAEERYQAALRSDDACVNARLDLSKRRMPGPDSTIRGERMTFPIGTRMFDRDQPALTPEEAEIVRRFHELYYRHWLSEADTINLSWFGYEVRKCPLDLWIYQELLVRTRPDLVIETGTLFGGSALFMATVMDVIGHGRVISIDRDDRPGRPAHPRISYWLGSSVDDAVVAEAHNVARHGRTMVVLDSDHSTLHVYREMVAYSPLVQVGDYLVVEDTNVNGHPAYPGFGPGPMEAVEKFLAESSEFAVDARCERFLLTMNPRGYLKRVRPIEKMK
jgi:cephalosporin hydroxylase